MNTVSTQAYVAGTSALATAGTAISSAANRIGTVLNNARDTANTAVLRAAVWADNIKAGGGAIGAAKDFVQAATSNRSPPAPNSYGAAGLALKTVIKILSQ